MIAKGQFHQERNKPEVMEVRTDIVSSEWIYVYLPNYLQKENIVLISRKPSKIINYVGNFFLQM